MYRSQPRCELRRRTHAQGGPGCVSTKAGADSTVVSICMPGRDNRASPDPDNVFAAAPCGHSEWNFAGAADVKESTSMRELPEKEENSSQYRSASIDRGGH